MPAGGFSLPCSRRTIAGPHRVYHVPPVEDAPGLGVPSPPQAGVFTPGNRTVPVSHVPESHRVIHVSVVLPNGRSTRDSGASPYQTSPRPRSPVWIRRRSGFSPQLHTPPLPQTHVRVGMLPNTATLAPRGLRSGDIVSHAPEGVEPSRPCGHPVTSRIVCTLLPLGTVARAPGGTRTRTSASARRHAAVSITGASVRAGLSKSGRCRGRAARRFLSSSSPTLDRPRPR